jgi:transcriptional regulator of arginine metabolism
MVFFVLGRCGLPSEQEVRESRQRQILSLVRRVRVTGQQQVVDLLHERGIEATQSSVSRDFAELGVVKSAGRYQAPRRDAAEQQIDREIAHYLRSIRPAGPNLTVIQTMVGAAQTVALAVDRAGWPEVVGTLGGDDTVFLATAGTREQKKLIQRLEAAAHRGEEEGVE